MSHDQLAGALLAALAPAFGAVLHQLSKVRKEVRRLAKFEIEHEMLVDMYCDHKGIKRGDLPTRHTNGAIKSE